MELFDPLISTMTYIPDHLEITYISKPLKNKIWEMRAIACCEYRNDYPRIKVMTSHLLGLFWFPFVSKILEFNDWEVMGIEDLEATRRYATKIKFWDNWAERLQ